MLAMARSQALLWHPIKQSSRIGSEPVTTRRCNHCTVGDNISLRHFHKQSLCSIQVAKLRAYNRKTSEQGPIGSVGDFDDLAMEGYSGIGGVGERGEVAQEQKRWFHREGWWSLSLCCEMIGFDLGRAVQAQFATTEGKRHGSHEVKLAKFIKMEAGRIISISIPYLSIFIKKIKYRYKKNKYLIYIQIFDYIYNFI